MKLFLIAVLNLLLIQNASAALETNSFGNCRSGFEKQQLMRYLDGKSGSNAPSCYQLKKAPNKPDVKRGFGNCSSVSQKSELMRYLDGKQFTPPGCFVSGVTVPTKPSRE